LDPQDFFGPVPKSIEVENPIQLHERYLPFSDVKLAYFDGALRDQYTRSHNYIAYVPAGIVREASIPDLYHYTKGVNFNNIIQSQELWASQIGAMNDHSEVFYTKDLFLIQLSNIFDGHPDVSQVITRAQSAYDDYVCKDTFSISFSKRANLLSQWNRYSDSTGVSIGFSGTVLLAACNRGWRFVEVEYDISAQAASLLEIANRFVIANVQSMADEDFKGWFISTCKRDLDNCSVSFKHPGFKEECEVRLVKDAKLHSIELQPHPSGNRKYLPLSLSQAFQDATEADSLIRYLFTSPSQNPRPRMEEVYSLFKKTQTKFLVILDSGISYSWPAT
jgi:Protein of unknown function (DUF2971)